MEVVSPTRVAAPWRLEEIAMAMMLGTGEMFSFLAMMSATGATISTVATLSTNAEMIPANSDRATTAHFTSGIRSMIRSARSDGILDSMNSETTPIVPAIIRMTFQSTEPKTLSNGRMPSATNSAAEARAMAARNFGNTSNRT
jgi:hypothetical protein